LNVAAAFERIAKKKLWRAPMRQQHAI